MGSVFANHLFVFRSYSTCTNITHSRSDLIVIWAVMQVHEACDNSPSSIHMLISTRSSQFVLYL